MKVQFIRDHDGAFTYGTLYLEGDVITVPDANGAMLVDLGAAVKVEDEPKPEPKVVKPKWVEVDEKPKGKK